MKCPFQYGKVVSAPFFVDREDEFASIMDHVESLHNLILYSPRRYGKTSLLKKVENEILKKNYQVIYIDFFKVTSMQSFLDLFLKEILKMNKKNWNTFLKKLSTLIKGVKPSVSFDMMGNPTFSIAYENSEIIPQTFESVINLTETFKPGQKWLVIFDEFQEIKKLNGDSFEEKLRSVIQLHTNTSYIMSGSRYHMLLDLFNKPGKAFYQFGKLFKLNKINRDFMINYIIDRFKSTGLNITCELASQIIDQTDNIPNYVQYLAAEVWFLSYKSNHDIDSETIQNALLNLLDNQSDYFYQIWDNLSNHQKKTLIAVSLDPSNLYSSDYQSKFNLGAVSSIQRSIEKLLKDEILIKENLSFFFNDPIFKQFIKLRITA